MQLMIIRDDGLSRQAHLTLRLDSQNDRFDLIEDRIVQCLEVRPSSSISEIAKELRVNRSTASKYLHVLRAKRRVSFRQVGPVKLWSLEAEK
jgi:predicted transcriptional regulator